ncbi:MAG: glycosyltransferase [Lachnospiraceae bacterium]|nr:glycosyltransferase [Lachnospiraceae bacterium]
MKRGKAFFTQIQKAERPYEYWLLHNEEWRGERKDYSLEKDFLSRFTIYRPRNTVNDPDCAARFSYYEEQGDYDFIYCDDDVLKDGVRTDPFFRPEYGPETFESFRDVPGLFAVRKDIVDEYGDDFMKYIDQRKILHIPEVLCHFVKFRPFIETDEESRGLKEECEEPVSIVILSKDHPEFLQRCVDSILASEPPKGLEIITVDNGSSPENRKLYRKLQKERKIDYITNPCEFNFSELCNLGARRATGNYLIFLNDDIEIPRVSKHFIQRLTGQAKKDHAGAVGMKLLYPESRKIQHCGISLQKSGPSHILCGYPDEEEYYFGFSRKTVNVTAVTGACLCVRRELFDRVNGFDEKLPLAYNDVDLCIRLMNRGFINICINDMYLYHLESATRKNDMHDREAYVKLKEYREYFAARHRDFMAKKDPYQNINITDTGADLKVDVKQDWEESGVELEAQENIGRIVHVKRGLLYGKDSTTYRISDEYLNEDYFEASGWIFFKRKKISDYMPAILVSSGEKRVLFDASRTFRKDVEKVFPRKKDACMSGFYTRVSRKVLELEGFSGHIDVTPVLRDRKGRVYVCEQRNG